MIATEEPGPAERRRLPVKRLIALCVAAAIAGLVARVAVAPLELPLAGLLQHLAHERGVDVSVSRVSVALGWGEVRVVLGGVGARTGPVDVEVAELALTQRGSGRSILVSGLELGVSAQEGAPMDLPLPGEAVRALDKALTAAAEAAAGAGLEAVEIFGARIDIAGPGRQAAEVRTFADLNARMAFGPTLSAEATTLGAGGRIDLSLRRTDEGGTRTIEISASGIVPQDLAPVRAVQSGFALSPRLVARVADDGTTQAELSLGIAEGAVILGKDPMRRLDRGRIALALAPGGRAVEVTASEFVAGRSEVAVTGMLTAGATPAEPWTFDLAAPGATFESNDIDRDPVVIEHLRARGTIDARNALLSIDALDARTEGGRANAALTFDFGPHGPSMAGAAHVGPTTADVLLGVWPAIVAHDPRMAVASSVKGGIVGAIDVVLALTREDLDGDPATPNPNPGAIAIDAAFVDATFGAPDLPVAVRRATGELKLRDGVLSVQLAGGVVAGDEGGELTITEAAFTIPNLNQNPAEASITATVEGPLAAVVSLAQEFGVAKVGQTTIAPADVSGSVTAELAMVTPLGPAVTMADRRWSIEATLNNAGTKVPLGGQAFSDANVRISANSRRLAAVGRAKIDGLSIDVNYSELFSGEKSGAARFVLTDKDRRERGFDTGDTVKGPVTVTLEQGEDGLATFEADFAEAAVSAFGFAKTAGRALVAVGKMRGEAPSADIEGLEVDGAGVAIRGGFSIDKGKLNRAEFSSFRLSEGDRARLSIGGAGNGFRVDAEAQQFDARRLFKAATAASPGTGKKADGPPITVTARGERIRVTDDTSVDDVRVEASHDGQRLQRLAVSGKIDGVNAGTFGARITPSASGQRRLQADVADLGRAAAALGFYERMRGGRTTLDAAMGDDGRVAGRLTVGSFQLANERTLEEIIADTRRSANGDDQSPLPLAYQAAPGAAAAGDGLAFETLTVEFEKTGGKVAITDAILRGRLLGGTASGEIDLDAKTVALNGTLIPAFGVNNLFGRVPVVGTILGAGRQGGLFGVTFRLEGKLDDPELSWNPLSAVAPGIFRRIFEYR